MSQPLNQQEAIEDAKGKASDAKLSARRNTSAKKKAKKTAVKKKTIRNKNGRPTNYKDDYAEQAYKLCLLGATDKELADFFGVTDRTINNWKKKVPEFFQSIKDAKTIADAEVAKSLNERARGYEYIEQQAIKLKEVIYENGKRVRETERVEVIPTVKKQAPDTTAGIYWLKNRRQTNWRDKVETEHSGIIEGVTISAEQAEQLIRARARRRDS